MHPRPRSRPGGSEWTAPRAVRLQNKIQAWRVWVDSTTRCEAAGRVPVWLGSFCTPALSTAPRHATLAKAPSAALPLADDGLRFRCYTKAACQSGRRGKEGDAFWWAGIAQLRRLLDRLQAPPPARPPPTYSRSPRLASRPPLPSFQLPLSAVQVAPPAASIERQCPAPLQSWQ